MVSVIQKCTKFAIFCILQHFPTKLGNFTNFDILFLTVVKDFDFFAKMKIQFKRGMVQSQGYVEFRNFKKLKVLNFLNDLYGVPWKK